MTGLSCDTCRFWMRLSQEGGVFAHGRFFQVEDGTGQCRFNPPVTRGYLAVDDPNAEPNSSDAALRAYWPVTFDEHWCGQHQPRLTLIEGGAA